MSSYTFVDEHFLELVKFSPNSFSLGPSCFTPFVNVSSAVLDVIQSAKYACLADMERHRWICMNMKLKIP